MNSLQHKPPPYYPLAPSSKNKKIIFPGNIRFVHRDVRLNKYHRLFCKIAKNARRVSKNIEGRKSINILKLLDEIIPIQYFGNTKHKNLFYKIVKLILTRSVYECVYLKQLIRGVNLHKVPWLLPILNQNAINAKILCKIYLFDAQKWLLEKIVKPLISTIYYPVRKGQTHEIELVPKYIWMSYQKKVIRNLKNMGHLRPIGQSVTPRGVLQVRPKNAYFDPNNFRPIIRLLPERNINKRKASKLNKEIIKTICAAAEKTSSTKTSKLYYNWKHFVATTEGQNIYGVKLDVKDAFGNIKISTLCDVLENKCMTELQIPMYIKNLIVNRITKQFVVFGKRKGKPKIWEWRHGLLQGDRFSSALCQLYMSHLDAIFLDRFYKPNIFIHRTVDDYFFCSTDKIDVEEFIKVMNIVHTLNINKTESNLENYGHHQIGYCGQIFDMNTKHVRTLYGYQKQTEIRHRFRFWNIYSPIFYKQDGQRTITEFLKKPMMFKSNNYRFKSLELNTVFNSETIAVQNYFEAMIFLAFKCDASIMAVYQGIKHFSLVTTHVKKVVYKYANRSMKKLEQNKGRYCTGKLSLKDFMKIGLQAFILVFKKRKIYKEVQLSLVKYMKRVYTNAIDFRHFKSLPKCFRNISISRRLPHQKTHKKLD